jgi:hypothetical protein
MGATVLLFFFCVFSRYFFFAKDLHFLQILDALVFLTAAQTTSVEFKLILFIRRCSAACPFSLIMLLIPATVISLFLAENQMAMQILMLRHKVNAVICVMGKCIFSFALHYKTVGISVTSNNTFCQ